MTKANLFLRIFEAIPGTLKCPNTLYVGECMTALYVIIYFFAKMLFYTWFGTDLLIVVERSKDIMHVKLLLSLVAKISDICECKREQVFVYMRDLKTHFFWTMAQAFWRIWNYAFHLNCLLVTKLLRLKMADLSDFVGFALTLTTRL